MDQQKDGVEEIVSLFNLYEQKMYGIAFSILNDSYLAEEGRKEVDRITWEKVGWRIRQCYDQLLSKGWFDHEEYQRNYIPN